MQAVGDIYGGKRSSNLLNSAYEMAQRTQNARADQWASFCVKEIRAFQKIIFESI